MVVKFLKAGSGDCILIQHEDYNILVDGGNENSFLLDEAKLIYGKQQKINLLIITHHDNDHIKGIIDFLKRVKNNEFGDNFIDKVIFNSPRKVANKLSQPPDKMLSYKQAFEVENLLYSMPITYGSCTDETPDLNFGDLIINFLSPSSEDLKVYADGAGEYLTSDFKCDWESSMAVLDKFITDDSQDKSLSNKISIVMSIECQGRKILLAGDSTPDRLQVITDKMVEENDGNPVSFDYIKLPHHGSYRSLNSEIIKNISCRKFIISTNGKRHYLPNKRAILKILKNLNRGKDPIEFLFNYEEALNCLAIADSEKKDYNFKLIKNNYKYGLGI